MHAAAYRYLRDPESCRDVVSDLYLKLLDQSPEERCQLLPHDPKKAEAFLFTALMNSCLNHLEKEKHRKKIRYLLFNSSTARFDPSEMERQDLAILLEMLTDRQRQVFTMHLQGSPNQEIEEVLRMSAQTVRNTLYDRFDR